MGETYGKKSTEAKSIIFNQIKNSLVKVVTNQPQLGNYSTTVFIGQHFLVFDKRKLKKK